MSGPAHLAVIAKEPRPGFAKTRLCPPCTAEGAAAIAEAALADTLDVVAAADAEHRTVVLEGATGPWLPAGFGVVPQVGGGLGDRLHAAFEACLRVGGPVVVVGMDTPQLSTELLAAAVTALGDHDAVLGPAADGGYWLIGLHHLHADAFRDVPMSTDRTYRAQRDRLVACGYRVGTVPALRDVDTVDDARAVAADAPGTRFAAAVAAALDGR